MKPFKKIAIAALAASVAGSALYAGTSAFAMGGPAFGNGGPGFMMPGGGFKGFGPRGGKRMMDEMFDRLDADKDGTITADEAEAQRKQHFTDADTDSNGQVNLDEFKAAYLVLSKPMQVRAFQFMDSNGDGEVKREEFDTLSDRLFSRLDRNEDGVVERLKVPPAAAAPGDGNGPGAGQGPRDGSGKRMGRGDDDNGRGHWGRGHDDDRGGRWGRGDDDDDRRGRWGRGDDDDGGRGHRGRGGERGGHQFGMRGQGGFGGPGGMFLATFDKDSDGKATREEFEAVRTELFATADADGSGAFTLEDFGPLWLKVNEDRVVRMFQAEDADGSLALTPEEAGGPLADFVDRHDRNGDGVVTKADFQKGQHGRGDGPGGKRRHHGDR